MPPVCEIDFYSDGVIRDPLPFYKMLRELGPVVYLAKNNLYAVSRYKEVSEVLRQPLRFSSSRGLSPIPRVNDILVGSTLNSDPPEHDRTRAITSEPLLPGALKDIEPKISAAAEGLVDTLCRRGSFDAISDLAQYLPLSIVVELVGLPESAGGDNMLKWASAVFNLFGTENNRARQAFEDLVDLREFLKEYGRPEKLREGGLAKRIFDVGPDRGFSYEQCAQLMRDYIAPSLDTTISTTGQIIKLFADHPAEWEKIRQNASLIPNAVEEAVRLATPIRAFTRFVAEDSEIAGHVIPEGERVLVIYASANRDERKFADPDRFDVTRDVHDHVGFGQGVHMCLGMHLARREIFALLTVLRRKVERFELMAEPTIVMNNTIRAYRTMPVKVHLSDTNLADDQTTVAPVADQWTDVIVVKREEVAKDIVALTLGTTNGEAFSPFSAGAHIDVKIRSGLIRQYSLCGDAAQPDYYRIGVLRETNSRGGSEALHDQCREGHRLRIGKPRNNFVLDETTKHTLLFAGGIGITPLLAMAQRLTSTEQSWELHYCARSRNRMAFVAELSLLGGDVTLYPDDEEGMKPFMIDEILGDPKRGHHVYVCGPNGFMEHVVGSARKQDWPEDQIHLERFGAEIDTNGAPFIVRTARSGLELVVKPGETIAENLEKAGIDVPVSCQSGVCGTCLTKVIEGTPDHRDLVQTDLEKAANDRITVCCSRSKTKVLVLDI